MKKVILSGILAIFSMGVFAQTSTKNLPATAQDFIQQNFSSVSVQEVAENSNWKLWADEKYEVSLSNGVELDFDKDGNIIEIDSNNDETIPLSTLPTNIVSYLNQNHPNAQITGWEKQNKEQEVELTDGTEIEFDGKGNFRKID